MESGVSSTSTSTPPAWQPLSARQRRVLGTLMEKSKTTPDAYPLTFLALTTGCNQKSNRDPVNNYSQAQIEETVDYLKSKGAVTLVQGNGRVEKVRHYAYQWLGISKVEAAIMTELLLRGAQTLGELRTRASRMEPIADLAELQRLLDDLQQRDLVLFLTPKGRGQVVSHNLYQDTEKAELIQQYVGYSAGADGAAESVADAADSAPRRSVSGSPGAAPASPPADESVREEVAALRAEVEQLKARLRHLEEQWGIESSEDLSANKLTN